MNCRVERQLVFFFITLIWNTQFLIAQSENSGQRFEWLSISGFVSNSVKYDTRQTEYAREGELMLFPKPVELDKNGKDKNAFGRFGMYNIHSMMSFGMKGKELYGFKTSAKLEFDFFGSANSNMATARIRHAYMKIQNNTFGVILGQTWHPTFFIDCFPEIIAWGAAVPAHPFNRSPQIRLIYTPSTQFELSVSAVSQRDYTSSGPAGSSGDYLRNSGLPEFQFSIVSRLNNGFAFGTVVGYKTLVPRLLTDSLIAVKETISSYNLSGFVKYKTAHWQAKAHAIYGQDLSNLLILGGYGVDSINITNDVRTYKNYEAYGLWGETEYSLGDFSFGFFIAYVESPGNRRKNLKFNYGFNTSIESLIRWSPRIVYKKENLKFGLELSATTANYLDQTLKGMLIPANKATNYRLVFTSLFNF